MLKSIVIINYYYLYLLVGYNMLLRRTCTIILIFSKTVDDLNIFYIYILIHKYYIDIYKCQYGTEMEYMVRGI